MNCNAATVPGTATIAPTIPTPAATWFDKGVDTLRRHWREHAEHVRTARAMAVFADIDQHTLKDIGAPNWVIAEAAQRDDARDLRLIDLYRS